MHTCKAVRKLPAFISNTFTGISMYTLFPRGNPRKEESIFVTLFGGHLHKNMPSSTYSLSKISSIGRFLWVENYLYHDLFFKHLLFARYCRIYQENALYFPAVSWVAWYTCSPYSRKLGPLSRWGAAVFPTTTWITEENWRWHENI